jgi:DHA1 family multidrug resistance protein-like MFS transporter
MTGLTEPPVRPALRDEKTGLYAMVFLANMGWGVMSPVLANVQAEFGVSVFEIALANSVFGLARLILDVPIGLVMDRVDPRLVRFFGAAVLATGSVICALAGDFSTLLFGRFLHGIGAASIQVTNMVWISRLSTDERRGRDLGIFQAALQAGASFSPIVAGMLADYGTWRASFWFSAIMALLGFMPMLVGNHDWWNRVRTPVAQEKSPERPEAKPSVLVDPNRVLIVANLVTFVLHFSVSSFQNTVIPLFAGTVLGLEAGVIGLALGVSAVLRFVMSLVGGEVSDRYGRRAILVPGLIVIGIGILMFNAVTDLRGFWVAMLVLSIGRFGNNVPATVLSDHAQASRWNVLMGFNRAVGDLGFVMGPVAAGLLLQAFGYGPTTTVSAAMLWASAIAVMIGVPETRQRRSVLGGFRSMWRSRQRNDRS